MARPRAQYVRLRVPESPRLRTRWQRWPTRGSLICAPAWHPSVVDAWRCPRARPTGVVRNSVNDPLTVSAGAGDDPRDKGQQRPWRPPRQAWGGWWLDGSVGDADSRGAGPTTRVGSEAGTPRGIIGRPAFALSGVSCQSLRRRCSRRRPATAGTAPARHGRTTLRQRPGQAATAAAPPVAGRGRSGALT